MGAIPADLKIYIGVMIGLAVVLLAWPAASIIRHYRRLHRQPEERPQPECKEIIARATVVDLSCWVHTIGYKTPKTNQIFAVVFRLDDGRTMDMYIPEEMYHGLEKGQTGIATIRDGELYSFELD